MKEKMIPVTVNTDMKLRRHERQAVIEDMLLKRKSKNEIRRHIMLRYGCGLGAVDHGIREILEGWSAEDRKRLNLKRSHVIRRFEHLSSVAEEKDDIPTAVRAEENLADVLGMKSRLGSLAVGMAGRFAVEDGHSGSSFLDFVIAAKQELDGNDRNGNTYSTVEGGEAESV